MVCEARTFPGFCTRSHRQGWRGEIHGLSTRSPAIKTRAFYPQISLRTHIFKAGTHTSAGGTTLDFSDDVLQASASAYDPAIHEAPMVIGHPADNGPAFGWIASLRYAEGELHADPDQVNGDFEEMVQAGSF